MKILIFSVKIISITERIKKKTAANGGVLIENDSHGRSR